MRAGGDGWRRSESVYDTSSPVEISRNVCARVLSRDVAPRKRAGVACVGAERREHVSTMALSAREANANRGGACSPAFAQEAL